MNPALFFTPDIGGEVEIPERGIHTKTLHDDADVKLVLFGFSAGHEMRVHASPMPVALHFLQGEAELTLESGTRAVKAGAFTHMPPHLIHGIKAKTPLVMLLIMMKGSKREKAG